MDKNDNYIALVIFWKPQMDPLIILDLLYERFSKLFQREDPLIYVLHSVMKLIPDLVYWDSSRSLFLCQSKHCKWKYPEKDIVQRMNIMSDLLNGGSSRGVSEQIITKDTQKRPQVSI